MTCAMGRKVPGDMQQSADSVEKVGFSDRLNSGTAIPFCFVANFLFVKHLKAKTHTASVLHCRSLREIFFCLSL